MFKKNTLECCEPKKIKKPLDVCLTNFHSSCARVAEDSPFYAQEIFNPEGTVWIRFQKHQKRYKNSGTPKLISHIKWKT